MEQKNAKEQVYVTHVKASGFKALPSVLHNKVINYHIIVMLIMPVIPNRHMPCDLKSCE